MASKKDQNVRKNFLDQGKPSVSSYGDVIKAGVSEDGKKRISELSKELSEIQKKGAGKVKKTVDGVVKTVGDMGKMVESGQKVVGKIVDGTERVKNVIEGIGEGGDVLEGVNELVNVGADRLTDIISTGTQEAGKYLGSGIIQEGNEIVKQVKQVETIVQDVILEGKQKIAVFIDTVKKIKEEGLGKDEVEVIINEGKDTLLQFMDKFGDFEDNEMQEVGKMINEGKNRVGQFIDGLKALKDGDIDVLNQMVVDEKKRFDDFIGGFENLKAKKAEVDGIVNAGKSRMSEINEAMSSMFTTSVDDKSYSPKKQTINERWAEIEEVTTDQNTLALYKKMKTKFLIIQKNNTDYDALRVALKFTNVKMKQNFDFDTIWAQTKIPNMANVSKGKKVRMEKRKWRNVLYALEQNLINQKVYLVIFNSNKFTDPLQKGRNVDIYEADSILPQTQCEKDHTNLWKEAAESDGVKNTELTPTKGVNVKDVKIKNKNQIVPEELIKIDRKPKHDDKKVVLPNDCPHSTRFVLIYLFAEDSSFYPMVELSDVRNKKPYNGPSVIKKAAKQLVTMKHRLKSQQEKLSKEKEEEFDYGCCISSWDCWFDCGFEFIRYIIVLLSLMLAFSSTLFTVIWREEENLVKMIIMNGIADALTALINGGFLALGVLVTFCKKIDNAYILRYFKKRARLGNPVRICGQVFGRAVKKKTIKVHESK